MAYRVSADEPLPDILTRSTRRAAILLAALGALFIAFCVLTFFQTAFVGYAMGMLGVGLEISAIVFYARNRSR
jgi:hypothetical protein